MNNQSEYNKLKECTFAPNTKKKISDRSRIKLYDRAVEDTVRGMEAVHRKRDKVLQKKLEKERREKEVFDFASKYDKNRRRHDSHTIPEPFKLSKVF